MRFSFSIVLLFFAPVCFAQRSYWKFENEQSVLKLNTTRLIVPKAYKTLSINFNQYKGLLQTTPSELTTNIKNGLVIELPYPDNSFKKFKIVETKIMEDRLADQFPEIKTYLGQGIDEPWATVRIDYTYQGLHAYIISPQGTLFIDPYQKGNKNLYITYFAKDYINLGKENFKCTLDKQQDFSEHLNEVSAPLTGPCVGTQ